MTRSANSFSLGFMLNKIEINRKRLVPPHPWWGVSSQPLLQVKHFCAQDNSALQSLSRSINCSWQNVPSGMALVSVILCLHMAHLVGKGFLSFKHIHCGCALFGLGWEKLLAVYIPHGCIWCLCWLFPWSSQTNSCHELGLAPRAGGWSTVFTAVFTALYLLGLWFQCSRALPRDFGTSFNVQEFSIPHFQEVLRGKRNFQAVGSALVICNQIFSSSIWKMCSRFQGRKR